MILTIGLTETDRAADYVPAMDGFRAGAAQRLWTFYVPANVDAVKAAEAVFVATNAPIEVIRENSLALTVYLALQGYEDRALSVGDTVTVNGERVACDRVGWIAA